MARIQPLALIAIVCACSVGIPLMPCQSADAELLVSAQELQLLIQKSPTPVDVLDIRIRDEYEAGHIPNAKWVDIASWSAKTFEQGGLTDKQYWEGKLGELGLAPQRPVVVAGSSLPDAARAWWLLRFFGMPEVQLLDGGYDAWDRSRLPLTSESVGIEATEFVVDFQTERLGTLADVTPAQGSEECQILDNRSEAEFSGARGVGNRTGHIPGARHLEWKRFTDEQGKFLPADALRALLNEQGIDLGTTIVAHCQTGGRSSVAVFALELAGVPNVKNYYPGWSEYANMLTAPVEQSSAQQ